MFIDLQSKAQKINKPLQGYLMQDLYLSLSSLPSVEDTSLSLEKYAAFPSIDSPLSINNPPWRAALPLIPCWCPEFPTVIWPLH